MKPLVTVVITCHNYGRYLEQCVQSVLDQTYSDIQVYIVNDASTDDTQKIAKKLPVKRVLAFKRRRGLAVAANSAMLLSDNGGYLMRLDADDWLHPNCISAMVDTLEKHEDHAAVFSDYWSVNESTHIPWTQDYVHQYEDAVPLGSCMLIRKCVFEDLNGYDETLNFQEDYDFYVRLAENNHAMRISLPLWYYRKHEEQMSNAHNERMRARQSISQGIKILTVIPARAGSKGVQNKNLREIAGVSLVARAIRMVKASGVNTLLAVSTDSSAIAAIAREEGAEVIARPPELARDEVSTIPVVKHAMEHMDKNGWRADIVISVQPTCPYTPPDSLREAVTLLEENPNFDSVVSVAEVTGTHPYRAYHLMENSFLDPYFMGHDERYLQRQDRPKAHGFTGGFYVRRRNLLRAWSGKDFAIGACYGVEVPQEAAIDIDTEMDLWLAETIVNRWGEK